MISECKVFCHSQSAPSFISSANVNNDNIMQDIPLYYDDSTITNEEALHEGTVEFNITMDVKPVPAVAVCSAYD